MFFACLRRPLAEGLLESGVDVRTLLFETLKNAAEREIPREMRPVLGQIFAEFTVLGFLGVATYFLTQMELLQAWSRLVYGDDERLAGPRRARLGGPHSCGARGRVADDG